MLWFSHKARSPLLRWFLSGMSTESVWRWGRILSLEE